MNIPVISLAVNRGLPVLVLDRDEHVEHVAVALVLGRVGDPVVHDLLHQRNEAQPRLVAQPEALDRQVRVDVAQRVGALFELVVEPREPAVELLAELLADQARRGGVDGQLGEEVEQVDLTGVAPVGDHPADLALDRGGVALHLLTAQCGVVQHLFAALGIGVEHHPFAEDRRHERIRRRLIEILVAGPEEELVGLRTGQEHHLLAGELEDADVAAFLAALRLISPIGSVRNSSRWPCSSSPPDTRGTVSVVMTASLPVLV